MADDPRKPVGYWVKHLDTLLEKAFDHALANKGVRRRHWQVLNALRAGPVTRAEITEALLPFWVAASVTQTDVVDDLVRRGWAALVGDPAGRGDGSVDRYALTPDGEAAHAAIEREVVTLRARITEGFSQREYHAVVDALAKMAGNIERALGQEQA